GSDGTQLEGVPDVRGAAADLPALQADDGKRLTGQRRLVDDRLGAGDDAVDRDDLPGANDDGVAHAHPLDRHFLDARRRANVCDARRPADERRQLAARTTGGPLLEGVPAREHQRDHGPGGPLPERKRSRDRDQGDGVDADVPAEQGTGHAQGQRQQDEHGAGGEDGVAGLRLSTEVKETAGGEGDEGGGGEQPLAHRPYQVFALGGRSAGRTRTRASTATQPSASPKTGFRSSSATSGISS